MAILLERTSWISRTSITTCKNTSKMKPSGRIPWMQFRKWETASQWYLPVKIKLLWYKLVFSTSLWGTLTMASGFYSMFHWTVIMRFEHFDTRFWYRTVWSLYLGKTLAFLSHELSCRMSIISPSSCSNKTLLE